VTVTLEGDCHFGVADLVFRFFTANNFHLYHGTGLFLLSAKQAKSKQQSHSSCHRHGDLPNETSSNTDTKNAEYPSADKSAEDADDNGLDQAGSHTANQPFCSKSSSHTDLDPDENLFN